MNFAADVVNAAEVIAELPDLAVKIITCMMRVLIGKWPFPGMANDAFTP